LKVGSRFPFPPMFSYKERSDPLIIHPLPSLQFGGQAGEFLQVFDFNKAVCIPAVVSFGNGIRIFPKSGKIMGRGLFPRVQTFKKPGSPRLHLHPALSGPSADGYPFCSPATALSRAFTNWPTSVSPVGFERQPSPCSEMRMPSFIRFRCSRLNRSDGAPLRMGVR